MSYYEKNKSRIKERYEKNKLKIKAMNDLKRDKISEYNKKYFQKKKRELQCKRRMEQMDELQPFLDEMCECLETMTARLTAFNTVFKRCSPTSQRGRPPLDGRKSSFDVEKVIRKRKYKPPKVIPLDKITFD